MFLQTSTCFFQRDAGCREHTPAAPGEQYSAQLQSPCPFLSPLPEISTLLLNPKYWLCPFVVGSGPGLQLFLCKHKGRARLVCVSSLILTAVVLTFGGVLHAQEYQQISSGPEKTDLPLPPCAFLTSSAQPTANTAGEERPKYTRFVGAGLIPKINL